MRDPFKKVSIVKSSEENQVRRTRPPFEQQDADEPEVASYALDDCNDWLQASLRGLLDLNKD